MSESPRKGLPEGCEVADDFSFISHIGIMTLIGIEYFKLAIPTKPRQWFNTQEANTMVINNDHWTVSGTTIHNANYPVGVLVQKNINQFRQELGVSRRTVFFPVQMLENMADYFAPLRVTVSEPVVAI